MIYRNMEAFAVSSADGVVKVGDTVSDIKEGKSAGVFSIGIIEGSSEMGLSREEYDSLTGEEKIPQGGTGHCEICRGGERMQSFTICGI